MNIKKRAAVKKTTKTAAKKTPPKPRRITLDDLTAVVAETEARIAKSREETDKALRKSREETDKALRKSREETDKALNEALSKLSAEVQRVTSNLEGSYGGVSARLGKLTELIVVPKLRHNMNALGHNFNQSEPDTLIRSIVNGRKEDIAQVDMLLRGPSEAMAVEIKARLKEAAVRIHLERLQDLRDHEEEAGINGKKLFGAVVGITIDDFARKVAMENGLYVVEIHEEEGMLDVEKPEVCRVW